MTAVGTVMVAALEAPASDELAILIVGLGILGVAVLLRPLTKRSIPFPLLVVVTGMLVWAIPSRLPAPDPRAYPEFTVAITELGVIVSLMGVGLKIDRFPSFSGWSSTSRLLLVAMPLTIAAVGLLGWWWLGLTPALAVLLGAVVAPTDPVLASDVQVGEPLDALDDRRPQDAEDEPRFALTSEAGLNDALAFPFVYLAIHWYAHDAGSTWILEWLAIDVVFRLVVGIVLGAVCGRAAASLLLRLSRETERDRVMTGLGALAVTLITYGVTEAMEGYGFLAVFVAAVVIRHRETNHESHRSLHVVAEQSEQLMMALILLAFGGAITTGSLGPFTLAGAATAVVVVFVVRPVAGHLSLLRATRLNSLDRRIVAFYGVRGIGSFFYLAYAGTALEISQDERSILWGVLGLTVLVSLLVHGTTAPIVMKLRDRSGRAPGSSKGDTFTPPSTK